MALDLERVLDGGLDCEEALGRPGRLEALHLAFSPSHRLMRILCPIVSPETLIMSGGQPFLPDGSAIGTQFIGCDALGREALLFQQLAQQSRGRLGGAPGLDEEIQNLALIVNCPPEPMFAATDIDGHLIQMPARTWLRAALAQVARDKAPELQEPAPNRLVRDVDAAFGEHFLNVPERQREAGIDPDGMHDDRRRKAMALERDGIHRPSI